MTKRHRIRWTPVAVDDLKDILSYVARSDGLGAARRLHRSFLQRIRTLSSSPARCRVVPELREVAVMQYRELLVGPYRIVFRLERQTVGVIAILDGRRDLEALLLDRALREKEE